MWVASGQRERATSARRVLLIAGIVLIAANLRGPLTMVGPLLETIRAETGLSAGEAGLLPALPLLAFAIVSPSVSGIAGKLGLERLLWIALVVLAAGIVVRSVPAPGLLWAGTLLLGLAIAVGNVLMPSLIKRDFPDNVSVMTGVYSTVMSVVGAVVSGLAVPIAAVSAGGWRGALASLAGFVLIAVAVWWPQSRTPPATAVVERAASGPLWRSALAWQVTAYMGLQSLGFYVVLSWLPSILQDWGSSAEGAGWALFYVQVLGVTMTAAVPVFARRMRDQRALAAGGSLLSLIGYLGLMLAPAAAPLWVTLIGLATGTCFVLALSFLSLRAADSRQAAALSGMAQAVGYSLAAVGPVLFGALHDVTDGWTVPLAALSVAAVAQMIAGLGAGRAREV